MKILSRPWWLSLVSVCALAAGGEPFRQRVEPEAFAPDAAREVPDASGGRAVALPFRLGLGYNLKETVPGAAVWLRFAMKAGDAATAALNGGEPAAAAADGDGWVWLRLVPPKARELRFDVTAAKGAPLLDVVVMANVADFDPRAWSLEELAAVAARPPAEGAVDRLFERDPFMDPETFARGALALHGQEVAPPGPVVDEHGAILFRGKPVFPLGFFRTPANQPELAKLPLTAAFDSYGAAADHPRERSTIQTYWNQEKTLETCYQRARAAYASGNVSLHYLGDEPEVIGVTPDELRRLNALVKAADPNHPTMLLYCTFATPGDYYRIADVVGLDHYPIPDESVFMIGWFVDKARYESGDRPVVFTVQAFDWRIYGREKGRFPTGNELAAMTFVPVIHGARGILFYEYFHPAGTDQKISELFPNEWRRIVKLIEVLDTMKNALTGPMVAVPGKLASEVPVRFALSADAKEAFLILANDEWKTPTVAIDWSAGPLRNVRLTEMYNDGVTVKTNTKSKSEFALPAGRFSAVFRVEANGLDRIKPQDRDERLREVKARLDKVKW